MNSNEYFGPAYFPNEIYINGYPQNIVNYSYVFNKTDNYVELIWNNKITNCDFMFASCFDIINIDFINFDTSQVNSMYAMFYGCSSLTSLDLSNFNTLQVGNMGVMFYGCSSLTSLDLSTFITSPNMGKMFFGCINLEYINIPNINGIEVLKLFIYDDKFDISNNLVICIDNDNNNVETFYQE